MPAAAVIPAPIAYTKVVAVKKLVVGFLVVLFGPLRKECVLEQGGHPRSIVYLHSVVGYMISVIYCE